MKTEETIGSLVAHWLSIQERVSRQERTRRQNVKSWNYAQHRPVKFSPAQAQAQATELAQVKGS